MVRHEFEFPEPEAGVCDGLSLERRRRLCSRVQCHGTVESCGAAHEGNGAVLRLPGRRLSFSAESEVPSIEAGTREASRLPEYENQLLLDRAFETETFEAPVDLSGHTPELDPIGVRINELLEGGVFTQEYRKGYKNFDADDSDDE